MEVSTSSSNDTVNKLKGDTTSFLQFLVQQCKTPSSHLSNTTSGLQNSMLSIIFYILLTSSAFYVTSPFDLSYFQFLFHFSILLILFLAINLISIASTAKLFSIPEPIAELTRKLGGFYAIPILLTVVSLVLSFLDANAFASIVLLISVCIAFALIPLFVMMNKLTAHAKSIDEFNGILFYAACTVVASIIVMVLIRDTALGQLVTYL